MGSDNGKEDKDNGVKGDLDVYLKTEWMWMLLRHDISKYYDTMAAISTWILLAAYVIMPSTFINRTGSPPATSDNQLDSSTRIVTYGIQYIGLAALSTAFALAGTLGCIAVALRHRQNYLWVCSRIYLPAMLNSFAGLLATLTNVYTVRGGMWSYPAKATAIFEGAAAGCASFLYIFYYFVMLKEVKKEHERHFPATYNTADPMNRLKYGDAVTRKRFASFAK